MTVPEPRDMSRYLIVLAVIGAARADATPGKIGQLRAEVLPLMEDPTVGLDRVVKRVFRVMGPDWKPTGEFGAWIDTLLEERKREGWDQ